MSYSILGYTLVISAVSQRVSLTALSRLQEDQERFNIAVNKTLELLALVYIPLTMGIASFSPWWIPILYGDQWQGLDKVILLDALPITAMSLFSILHAALMARGYGQVIFKQNVIHAVIYWVSMAMFASPLKALSVPLSRLLGMCAGYLFIYSYGKYCGKLACRSIYAYYLTGTVLMFISWTMVKNGNVMVPLILWFSLALIAFFLSSILKTTIGIFEIVGRKIQ
jgi:O-antigen/teichoic acid export membrane protein